jgi:hypothetical protein
MKIGVLSDTHGFLDDQVFTYFQECDEIWHAGDIGDISIAERLNEFKPFKAVYGNIDEPQIRHQYPEELFFEREGVKVLMVHIGGTPKRYTPGIKDKLKELRPNIFVCGHSHILKIIRDKKYNDLIYLNPGAAGRHGLHMVRTLVRFEIDEAAIRNMQVIELGKRSSID